MTINDLRRVVTSSVEVSVWMCDRDGDLHEVESGRFRELSEDVLNAEVTWIEAVDADVLDVTIGG